MGSVREERAFWVHQIHSTLLNSIGAAILQSRVCERAVRVGAPDRFEEIKRLQGILTELEAAARTITVTRTPGHAGRFISEVRRLIEAFHVAHPGVELQVEIPGVDSTVPRRAADATSVVLEEALLNVSHHAAASRVDVMLQVKDESILLRVRDDGRGFDISKRPAGSSPVSRTNWGFPLMREYAEMAGGKLEVSSVRGRGTQVTLFIPVREPVTLVKNS